MNFELIDNSFQVILLSCMMLLSVGQALRFQNRRYLMLAFTYACFAMGTLYFLLHVAFMGDAPQVFYVAEISWIAAYLFLLSVQLLRMEGLQLRLDLLSAVCAVWTGLTAVWLRVMGPALLFRLLGAVTMGTIVYLSVFRLKSRCGHALTDVCAVGCVLLQMALYLVSFFMQDFTRFNLYFAVDILLSLCFAALLPLNLREVKRR